MGIFIADPAFMVQLISTIFALLIFLATAFVCGKSWSKREESRTRAWGLVQFFLIFSIAFWGSKAFEPLRLLLVFSPDEILASGATTPQRLYQELFIISLNLLADFGSVVLFLRGVEGKWIPAQYLDKIFLGAKGMPKKRGEFTPAK